MDILLIHPPAAKPAEPPLGLAVLTAYLRGRGLHTGVLDANLGGYLYLLDPQRAAEAAGPAPKTSVRRALKHGTSSLELLRSPAATASFPRYATAVRHLHTLLSVHGAAGERLTLGDYEHRDLSPFDPDHLARLAAAGEEETLFAGYFRDRVLPQVAAFAPRRIALSVNYRHQVLPAFELAGLLSRHFPGLPIVGGGGMFTSWRSTLRSLDLRLPPFDHIVFGPGEEPLTALAGASPPADYFLDGAATDFVPDFSDLTPEHYLSPGPVLPVAASRGCYWGRCRFCPEAEAPTHRFGQYPAASFPDLLLDLAAQTGVRHFHLTDNAVPVATLRSLARRSEEMADLRWHGFVRFEEALLDEEMVRGLARGGCTMLQLGLESASQRVLDRMGKGTRLEAVAAILANLCRAGIASYVYVMLGTPGETAEDANATRAFLEAHAGEIGFLNLSLMNLPRDASLLQEADDFGILGGELPDGAPLSLYRTFAPAGGWGRKEARRFLKELQASPPIAAILRRTPPWFTSNHACFFPPGRV